MNFICFHEKFMNSADFACGSGTSVCGAKRPINSWSFLGIPDDTFAGKSWIPWFPRFSHKIMNFYNIHDLSGISRKSCFPAPSAPSGAMKWLRNYYCFLTLGAQRAQKRGFHQKSWNPRENTQNPPFYKHYVKFPWNPWFLLFPHLAAHLRKPYIILVNSMPFGDPIRSKSRVFSKKCGILWFPFPFWWNHLKCTPKPPFWWKSSKNQTFAAPGPSKHLRNA